MLLEGWTVWNSDLHSWKDSSTADASDTSAGEYTYTEERRRENSSEHTTATDPRPKVILQGVTERKLATAATNAVPVLGKRVLGWIHQSSFVPDISGTSRPRRFPYCFEVAAERFRIDEELRKFFEDHLVVGRHKTSSPQALQFRRKVQR